MKKVFRGLTLSSRDTSKDSQNNSCAKKEGVEEEEDDAETYEEFEGDNESNDWSTDEFDDGSENDDEDDDDVDESEDEEDYVNEDDSKNNEGRHPDEADNSPEDDNYNDDDDDDMYLNQEEACFKIENKQENNIKNANNHNDNNINNKKKLQDNIKIDNKSNGQPVPPAKKNKCTSKAASAKALLAPEISIRKPLKSPTPSSHSKNTQASSHGNVSKNHQTSDSESSADSYEDLDEQPTNKSKRVEATVNSEDEVYKLESDYEDYEEVEKDYEKEEEDYEKDEEDYEGLEEDYEGLEEDYEGIPSPIPEKSQKSFLQSRKLPSPPLDGKAKDSPSPAFCMRSRPLPQVPRCSDDYDESDTYEMEDEDGQQAPGYKSKPLPEPPQTSGEEEDYEVDFEDFQKKSNFSSSSHTLKPPLKHPPNHSPSDSHTLPHKSLHSPSHSPIPASHSSKHSSNSIISSRPLPLLPLSKLKNHTSLPARKSPILDSKKTAHRKLPSLPATLKETKDGMKEPISCKKEEAKITKKTSKIEKSSLHPKKEPATKPSETAQEALDQLKTNKAIEKAVVVAVEKPLSVKDRMKCYEGVLGVTNNKMSADSAKKESVNSENKRKPDENTINKCTNKLTTKPKEGEEEPVVPPMNKPSKKLAKNPTVVRIPASKEPPMPPTNKPNLDDISAKLQLALKHYKGAFPPPNIKVSMAGEHKDQNLDVSPKPMKRATKERTKNKIEKDGKTGEKGSSVDNKILKSSLVKNEEEKKENSEELKDIFCGKIKEKTVNNYKDHKNEKKVINKTKMNYEDVAVTAKGRILMGACLKESKVITARVDADEKEKAENAAWFFDSISRSEATRKLKSNGKRGAYLIRKSQTGSKSTPFSLSVYSGKRVFNLQIRKKHNGQLALGTEKDDEKLFDSLHDMVTFHSHTPIEIRGEVSESINLVCPPSK